MRQIEGAFEFYDQAKQFVDSHTNRQQLLIHPLALFGLSDHGWCVIYKD